MYEGASSSASIATTSTLPLRTEPYDPFNAFGPLLDVYDALDAAAIGALVIGGAALAGRKTST